MTAPLDSLHRRIWRKILGFRHRGAMERHGARSEGLHIRAVAGLSVVVPPGVFDPALFRSGAFLAESLDESLVPAGSRVLDLGTGTGVAALVAAEWAAEVVAVDVNPDAVRAARANAILHRRERTIDVREGDLFAAVAGERFDVAIFNPPFFRGEPSDALDRAWRSPDLDRRFASELGSHLTPFGHALVCLSTDGELAFVEALEENGFAVEVVAERDVVNEVFRLFRARSRSSVSSE